MSEQPYHSPEQPAMSLARLSDTIYTALREQSDYAAEQAMLDATVQRAIMIVDNPAATATINLVANMMRWSYWGDNDTPLPFGLQHVEGYGGPTIEIDETIISVHMHDLVVEALSEWGLLDVADLRKANLGSILDTMRPELEHAVAHDPRIERIRQATFGAEPQVLDSAAAHGNYRAFIDSYDPEIEAYLGVESDPDERRLKRFDLVAHRLFADAYGSSSTYMWQYFDEAMIADILQELYELDPNELSFAETFDKKIDELADLYKEGLLSDRSGIAHHFEAAGSRYRPRRTPSLQGGGPLPDLVEASIPSLLEAYGDFTLPPEEDAEAIGTKGRAIYIQQPEVPRILRFVAGERPTMQRPETSVREGIVIALDKNTGRQGVPQIPGHDLLAVTIGQLIEAYHFAESADSPYRDASSLVIDAISQQTITEMLEQAGLTQLANAVHGQEVCSVQTLVEAIRTLGKQVRLYEEQDFSHLMHSNPLRDFRAFANAGRFESEGGAAAALLGRLLHAAFPRDAIGLAVGARLDPGAPSDLLDNRHVQVIFVKDGTAYYLDPTPRQYS